MKGLRTTLAALSIVACNPESGSESRSNYPEAGQVSASVAEAVDMALDAAGSDDAAPDARNRHGESLLNEMNYDYDGTDAGVIKRSREEMIAEKSRLFDEIRNARDVWDVFFALRELYELDDSVSGRTFARSLGYEIDYGDGKGLSLIERHVVVNALEKIVMDEKDGGLPDREVDEVFSIDNRSRGWSDLDLAQELYGILTEVPTLDLSPEIYPDGTVDMD